MDTQNPQAPVPAFGRSLTFLGFIVAISAIGGGIGLLTDITGRGMGFAATTLEGTPFDSFLIPGLALVVLVGGSAALATVAHIIGHPRAALFSLSAGAVHLSKRHLSKSSSTSPAYL